MDTIEWRLACEWVEKSFGGMRLFGFVFNNAFAIQAFTPQGKL